MSKSGFRSAIWTLTATVLFGVALGCISALLIVFLGLGGRTRAIVGGAMAGTIPAFAIIVNRMIRRICR